MGRVNSDQIKHALLLKHRCQFIWMHYMHRELCGKEKQRHHSNACVDMKSPPENLCFANARKKCCSFCGVFYLPLLFSNRLFYELFFIASLGGGDQIS